MRWKKAAARFAAIVIFASFYVVAVESDAHAGSGLDRWRWGDAGETISMSSNKFSNMSGFWQAVVNSNNCPLTVDGIFGNNTGWFTAVFQNEILGWNNGAVMNPSMLNAFHGATSVYGQRLSYTGYTDGTATQHYGYYGGFTDAMHTRLGWNPFGVQWLFSQYPLSNPTWLHHATPSRTIGSVSACA